MQQITLGGTGKFFLLSLVCDAKGKHALWLRLDNVTQRSSAAKRKRTQNGTPSKLVHLGQRMQRLLLLQAAFAHKGTVHHVKISVPRKRTVAIAAGAKLGGKSANTSRPHLKSALDQLIFTFPHMQHVQSVQGERQNITRGLSLIGKLRRDLAKVGGKKGLFQIVAKPCKCLDRTSAFDPLDTALFVLFHAAPRKGLGRHRFAAAHGMCAL